MPDRLEASVRAMAETYPRLTFESDAERDGRPGIWRGWVQPIKAPGMITELLDDLFHDRPVFVVGDEVKHLPSCTSPHCHHDWMTEALDMTRRFELLITYDGGAALPRCWVLNPAIPPRKRRHMWNDGAICAFLASDRVWSWNRDTVASLLPHVLIWLLKWTVFDQTGVWIGSEHLSNPLYHLRVVGPWDPCWCGSGSPYRKCHRKEDLALVRVRRVVWS
jgi:SEC-C motif